MITFKYANQIALETPWFKLTASGFNPNGNYKIYDSFRLEIDNIEWGLFLYPLTAHLSISDDGSYYHFTFKLPYFSISKYTTPKVAKKITIEKPIPTNWLGVSAYDPYESLEYLESNPF